MNGFLIFHKKSGHLICHRELVEGFGVNSEKRVDQENEVASAAVNVDPMSLAMKFSAFANFSCGIMEEGEGTNRQNNTNDEEDEQSIGPLNFREFQISDHTIAYLEESQKFPLIIVLFVDHKRFQDPQMCKYLSYLILDLFTHKYERKLKKGITQAAYGNFDEVLTQIYQEMAAFDLRQMVNKLTTKLKMVASDGIEWIYYHNGEEFNKVTEEEHKAKASQGPILLESARNEEFRPLVNPSSNRSARSLSAPRMDQTADDSRQIRPGSARLATLKKQFPFRFDKKSVKKTSSWLRSKSNLSRNYYLPPKSPLSLLNTLPKLLQTLYTINYDSSDTEERKKGEEDNKAVEGILDIITRAASILAHNYDENNSDTLTEMILDYSSDEKIVLFRHEAVVFCIKVKGLQKGTTDQLLDILGRSVLAVEYWTGLIRQKVDSSSS